MNEFPIQSQSSDSDKLAILKIRDVLSKNGKYNYCEIGSYLGGSLTPFINDNNCDYILSVDDRGKIQPDERGVDYDYRHISHQTMLDGLSKHYEDLSKLETFNGSIHQLVSNDKFDLIFIDGEHTDYACFRDFIYSQKYLKENSVVMFHDSNLIYKSLKIIQELLLSNKIEHKFIKISNSVVSFIFFGDYISFYKEFENEDVEKFYFESEVDVLQQIIKNRVEGNYIINDKRYETI
jgi:hypothetical protein